MRAKSLALILALMLLTAAQAREAWVVQAAGMADLVDADGRSRLQGAPVAAMLEIEPDALYAAGSAGDYGLIDARGNAVGDGRYEMLEAAGDAVLFRQNGRYGAMDAEGRVIVQPVWDQLTYAAPGAFLALSGDLYDDQPDEIVSVNSDGARDATGSFTADGLHPFSDGLMAFMQSDGQYGFVDAQGRQTIPPQWGYASDFSDGVAIVSDGSHMGLIDAQGAVVIAPQYAWMQRGEGFIAALTDDGGLDVYAADGGEKRFTATETASEAEICGRYVVLRDENDACLYDAQGRRLCTLPRTALFFPGLNGQVIVADGAWGAPCQYLLNPDGSAVPGRYQRLMPLCGGRYAFLRWDAGASGYDDARCGLLTDDGRELCPAEYLEILPAGDDRLTLVTESEVLFADLDGNALRRWALNETAASSSAAGA